MTNDITDITLDARLNLLEQQFENAVADVTARITALEGLLTFVAQSMRVRVAVPTGVLDATGKPTAQQMEGSLMDFYTNEQFRLQMGAVGRRNGKPS